MARRRRKSNVLERAEIRANNLKTISPTLDLGPGLTVADFEQSIADVRTSRDTYNQSLARLDDLSNELIAKEKQLDELNSRMLAGVGARWGKNSSQYEQAGGTRTAERKKPTAAAKKKKPSDS